MKSEIIVFQMSTEALSSKIRSRLAATTLADLQGLIPFVGKENRFTRVHRGSL